MDRLRRTLSFRSRKKGNSTNNNNNNNHTRTIIASTKNDNDTTTTAIATGENKLLQWQNDERAVRLGACSFNVKVTDNYFILVINRINNHFFLVSWQCGSSRIKRNAYLRTSYTSLIKCNY